MGIIELVEIGFFEAFYNFSNWILSLLIYTFMFAGFGIQFLLMRKSPNSNLKWVFLVFLTVDAIIFEILYQVMSGWDLFAILILYGLMLSCMMGAVISTLFNIKKR